MSKCSKWSLSASFQTEFQCFRWGTHCLSSHIWGQGLEKGSSRCCPTHCLGSVVQS
jgi:hypothetical protein